MSNFGDFYKTVHQQRSSENSVNDVFIAKNSDKIVVYLRYILALFEDKNFSQVNLKATGNAIANAVYLTEVVKRKIPGLHQLTNIASAHMDNILIPLVNGIDASKNISAITITLSKEQLDVDAVGYQSPLTDDEFKAASEYRRKIDDSKSFAFGKGDRGRARAVRSSGGRSNEKNVNESVSNSNNNAKSGATASNNNNNTNSNNNTNNDTNNDNNNNNNSTTTNNNNNNNNENSNTVLEESSNNANNNKAKKSLIKNNSSQKNESTRKANNISNNRSQQRIRVDKNRGRGGEHSRNNVDRISKDLGTPLVRDLPAAVPI